MAKLLSDREHGKNIWPPSKGTHAAGGVPGMAEHDFNAAVGDAAERLLKGKLSTFSAQSSYQLDVHLNTRIRKYDAEYVKDKSAIGLSYHGNANADKKTHGFGVCY